MPYKYNIVKSGPLLLRVAQNVTDKNTFLRNGTLFVVAGNDATGEINVAFLSLKLQEL